MGVASVKQYMKQVKQRHQAGGSTEHSYRGDLQQLIKELAKDVNVINEPKRQEFGAPDYVIKRNNIPIGYIEAKDVGVDLNKVEASAQMERYLKSLDNLILTDYLEFRFFRHGEKIKEIKVASATNKFTTYPEFYDTFIDYLKEFSDFEGQTITSAVTLARLMAQKARIMEDVLLKALKSDHADQTLRDQLKAFQEILIHDLTEDTFADIYTQTITYGMFAARLHDPNLHTFSRFEAAQLIPKSNPFLRNLFRYIADFDLDDRIAWIVDALADVFRVTDITALIKNLGDVTKQNDPMIHFYETFLAEYDPKLRIKRGVFYTPEPVVSFIVRAVNDVLISDFGLTEGIADNSKTEIKVDVQGKREKQEVHKVQILDPTVGTGTFMAEIIKLIYRNFESQQGVWNDYVENHLIPRLNGFELLMAPYAMAHLKLDLLLSETGYKASENQRLKIFLTNALEEYHPDTGTIFASWLSHEANDANYIKRDTPVMVIIGNPPYRGHSANKRLIWQGNDLLKDYKQEPGGGALKERNSKWLNDDYVKFIRYGQYFIDRNKEGVLAFITNHSFLDNPTFRGMRWHLLTTFDKIYIIDLHGSVKKKEVCPDGSPDENVFDIQQGASINIFIKTKKRKKKGKLGKVFHCDLYGKRDEKYEYLSNNSLESIDFKEITLWEPYYFFVDKDFSNWQQYEEGFSIEDLYEKKSPGIVTSKDAILIDFDNDALYEKVKNYYGIEPDKSLIKNLSYRPFDDRYLYYDTNIIERSRERVMKHFIETFNIGLMTVKKIEVGEFAHSIIYKDIVESHAVSIKEINYIFPLYLYEDVDTIFNKKSQLNRKPNLNTEITSKLENNLGLKFTPEPECTSDTFCPLDILDYIYAILHKPSYREDYKEFLKIDFPRIPYPNNKDDFWSLVALGGDLRKVHLLESSPVNNCIASYPEVGTNKIELVNYKSGKVWISKQQYFDNVPENAWNMYIGSYQPAQRWLKDRKGRVLGFDEVRHYQKIIKALVETDRIMMELDSL